ncbi:hypothetical protein HJG60_011521 [Phyllostomus discolor]|uniref:Uncharacterized protein n=1 Tax=Phyllostomus discolor TaxID=89673 RepID=A0A833ZTW0_9CHIR|nr:hypothetical protein HJG60_011521 [Phyllostomus discolor]
MYSSGIRLTGPTRISLKIAHHGQEHRETLWNQHFSQVTFCQLSTKKYIYTKRGRYLLGQYYISCIKGPRRPSSWSVATGITTQALHPVLSFPILTSPTPIPSPQKNCLPQNWPWCQKGWGPLLYMITFLNTLSHPTFFLMQRYFLGL